MKIYYDSEVDAVYIKLKTGTADRAVEIGNGVSFDLDKNGGLIGVEILDASKQYKDINRIEVHNIFSLKKRERTIKRRDKAAVQTAEKI